MSQTGALKASSWTLAARAEASCVPLAPLARFATGAEAAAVDPPVDGAAPPRAVVAVAPPAAVVTAGPANGLAATAGVVAPGAAGTKVPSRCQ